jgi:N-acetylglucosaminyl-diphospho-decaprenol L-rhamnosyltransferase
MSLRPMTTGPRVRVGIVSWNTDELLDRCLSALPAALDGMEADVVVVDNDSSDRSAEVAEGHRGVTVIRNRENVGYARGMNQALGEGDAVPYLIALNPDTEPPPGALASLVWALERDPGVAVAVPRLVGADGNEQHSVYRFPSLAVAAAVAFVPVVLQRRGVGRRFWLEGHSDHGVDVDVDWAIGAVHVIRAAALDGGPAYDERWFMYAEDIELCWRVRRAGWRVRLIGSVTVPHVGNASGAQAWGDDRTVRWLVPTYQFQAMARGGPAARQWAALNWAGLAWLRLKWRALARLDRHRYGHLAGWARDSAAAMALHRRVARRGVGALDDLPAGGPVRTV